METFLCIFKDIEFNTWRGPASGVTLPHSACEGRPAILCVSRLLRTSHCQTQRAKAAHQFPLCLASLSVTLPHSTFESRPTILCVSRLLKQGGLNEARIPFALTLPRAKREKAAQQFSVPRLFRKSHCRTKHVKATRQFLVCVASFQTEGGIFDPRLLFAPPSPESQC